MNNRRRILLSAAITGILVVSATAVALGSEILPGGNPVAESELVWQRQAADSAGGQTAGQQRVAAQNGTASGAPSATASDPARATTREAAAASIAYLRKEYGVSEDEAVRRIELQQASTGLAEKLAGAFPDEYAGMWLDQKAGVLTVAMTAPDKLAPAITGFAAAKSVRAVPAKQSLRQLTATAKRIAADLGVAEGADVAVDEPSNAVVVTTGDAVSPDDPRLAALVAGKEVVTRRGTQPFVAKACDPLHCAKAPMRGGIRLDVPRDDGTVGGCTTGFNVRSQTTGAYYVLTAGHCVFGGRHTRVDDTWHEFLGAKTPVTVEDPNPGLVENNYLIGHDYAIMPYQPGAVAKWWTVNPSQIAGMVNYCPPASCPSGRDIKINGLIPMSAIQVGWVVCATGSAYTPALGEIYVDSGAGRGYVPGTRCGEITGKDGRIGVRICARPGDSGGPLFTEADGKALGILSGGDPGQGACTNAQERNYYAPVSTILDRANSRTNNSLQLHLMTIMGHSFYNRG